MIVHFTGAQCSGKTTSAEYINNIYSDKIILFNNIVRNLVKSSKYCKINLEADNYSQSLIILNLLQKTFSEYIKSNNKVAVFERSFICMYAYSFMIPSLDPILLDYLKELIRFFYKELQIPLVYFSPLPFIEDGIRKKETQIQIDEIINKTIKDFNINVFKICSPIDKRLEEVKLLFEKQGWV